MNKIKEIIDKYKKEVIVSLITMIIISFLRLLFKYIRDGGKSFISLWTDYIYYKMSRMSELTIINTFCTFFLGMFIVMLLIISIEYTFCYEETASKKITCTKHKKPKWLLGMGFIICTLIIGFFLFVAGYSTEQKHLFDCKMTRLKPYLTQKEYDTLYSEWVSMVTKEDFNKINKKVYDLNCKYLMNDYEKKHYCNK